MNVVILLGAPGSGKGTIASRLAGNGIAHVSSGDLLRGAVAAKTPAGIEAKTFMDAGQLVPDTLIARMIDDYIAANTDVTTMLLDGFPRTLPQADMLDATLAARGAALTAVLLLEVPDALVIQRLSGRRLCSKCGEGYHIQNLPPKQEGICDKCGGTLITRADDNPATIQNRLAVYAQQTTPLIARYAERGLLRRVDATGEIDGIVVAAAQAIA